MSGEKLERHLPYALRQFDTDVLVPFRIFGLDMSLTGVGLAKITTAALIVIYFIAAMREGALVPRRLQLSAEIIYSLVADTLMKIAGPEARPSLPFVMTVTTFVFFGTLLGMTPLHETFTSHLAVTLSLALLVFGHVNLVAFRKHGLGYLRIFSPQGVPIYVAPIISFVEVVSYLFRPITLGFRLFANIVAGHIMLKLFGDFAAMLVSALGSYGVLAALAPTLIMVALYGFEIMIVCIQTYIFLLITSMYLRDAVHGH